MKALKITLTHGRIWTAETSSGVRAQSSTMEGALQQLLPAGFDLKGSGEWGIAKVFDGIPDSGGDGNIGRGQAAG